MCAATLTHGVPIPSHATRHAPRRCSQLSSAPRRAEYSGGLLPHLLHRFRSLALLALVGGVAAIPAAVHRRKLADYSIGTQMCEAATTGRAPARLPREDNPRNPIEPPHPGRLAHLGAPRLGRLPARRGHQQRRRLPHLGVGPRRAVRRDSQRRRHLGPRQEGRHVEPLADGAGARPHRVRGHRGLRHELVRIVRAAGAARARARARSTDAVPPFPSPFAGTRSAT